MSHAVIAGAAARFLDRGPRRHASPGALAVALDSATRTSPALDLIDDAIVQLADTDEHDALAIFLAPQEGKALALDTPIGTPGGWTTMGALAPGDAVIGGDGKPCHVTWVSPVWRDRPCYRVLTGDGESIVADAEHEWRARLKRESGEGTHTTKVLAHPRSKQAQITGPAGIELPEAMLPLDPYVLGSWLGDGHTGSAQISAADQHIVDRIRAAGVPCRKYPGRPYAYSLAPAGSRKASPVRLALISLGVWRDKHIPVSYQRASRAQRLALLQGLVDTDGHVIAKGQVEFCTTRRRLAEDVRDLVFTLGAKAVIGEDRARLYGRDCGPRYRVRFYLAGAASVPRKAARCRDSSVATVRYVRAEPCEGVPVRCIEVDSPDHTYLAGRTLLRTHNSQKCSRRTPEWLLDHDPSLRIGIVSYQEDLAVRWGRDIKRDISLHPCANGGQCEDAGCPGLHITIRQDSSAAGRWDTPEGGGVFCVGVGGPLAGRPLDWLAIDDPVKDRAAAESATIRDSTWDWWESVGLTRLAPGGRVLLISTRWHQEDLAGRILSRPGPLRWRVIRIPAIAGDDDPLGRLPGEELVSARGRAPGYFRNLQATLSPYVFSGIYQQDPVAAEGNFFRRAAFRYWRTAPPWSDGRERISCEGKLVTMADCWTFGTVDVAASVKTSADWTVISAWAVSVEGDLILLERARARVEQHDHFGLADPLMQRWNLGVLYVERGFFASTLVKDARDAGYPVAELVADVDKVTRAIPAAGRVHAGKVWFPAETSCELCGHMPGCGCPHVCQPWLDTWTGELAAFPSGANDDQVDTMSYAALVVTNQWTRAATPSRPVPSPHERAVAAAYASATGSAGNGHYGSEGGELDIMGLQY